VAAVLFFPTNISLRRFGWNCAGSGDSQSKERQSFPPKSVKGGAS
jgi:hypothetical protein